MRIVKTRKIYLMFLGLLTSLYSVISTGTLPVVDYSVLAQTLVQVGQLKEEAIMLQRGIDGLHNDQYEWSNAQELINKLGQTIKKANGLAYSADNINQEFKQAYPGYQAPENYSQQYRDNVNRTQNTLGGTLQSLNVSAQDFQNENARLAFLQKQSHDAKGQTQAIQAASQIASETVSQIQLLRQTVMAQTNAQAAYYAQQVQAEASSQAMLEEVISAGSTDVPEYGSSGNYLKVPKF